MRFNNYDKLCQYYYWEQYRRRTLLNYKYAQNRYIAAAQVYVIPIIPSDTEEIKKLVQKYNYATIYSSEGLVSIGLAAFRDQQNLTYINIPKVQYIGALAFYNCLNLETVSFAKKDDDNIPILDNINAFIDENGKILPKLKIIVPDNLYSKWIQAPNWTVLKDRIFKESSI